MQTEESCTTHIFFHLGGCSKAEMKTESIFTPPLLNILLGYDIISGKSLTSSSRAFTACYRTIIPEILPVAKVKGI